MESLALVVTLILLFVISLPAIALGVSFFEHKAIPVVVYLLALASTGFAIWIAIASNSTGIWILVLVITLLNAIAIWNMNRVNK